MGLGRRQIVLALWSLGFSVIPAAAVAQDAAHDHTQMNMPANSGWQLMQDGIVFAELSSSCRIGGWAWPAAARRGAD